MIIDRVEIFLKAGNGGEGSSSHHKLSSGVTIGIGGNGGNGGDVILKVSPHLYDLSKFKGTKKFIAANGQRGQDNNKKGKAGENRYVEVPLGTLVKDLSGKILVDLAQDHQEYIICHGGNGGKGNYKRDYNLEPGHGEEKNVILDYRICADVAIIGFANTGKTSLFNALTGKSYKVAHYPYTTQACVWAKSVYNYQEFTVLDTPALKPKKETWQDSYFLKHLFRSRVILFLSDNQETAKNDFSVLKEAISCFDKGLLKGKIFFYLLTKIDKIEDISKEQKVITVSVNDQETVEFLKKAIIEALI